MTGTASATPAPPASGDVDTRGWDTVVAMSFINANKSLVSNWPNVSDKVKNVQATASDDPSYHISGVLGPWQLIVKGGDQNVRMACPFASCTYTASGKSWDLGAAKTRVLIEIDMEWVPDPGQFFFVIDDDTVKTIYEALDNGTVDTDLRNAFTAHGKTLGTGPDVTPVTAGDEWAIADGANNYYVYHTADKYKEYLNIYQLEKKTLGKNLKVQAGNGSEEVAPPVVIIGIENNPVEGEFARDVLPALLSDWFNLNIGEMNHVFASLDFAPIISDDDKYAWMKPTRTSYAVADTETIESGVFGVLSMAQNRKAPTTTHQVDPNAIPEGADAAFLIAGPRFLQYMLLAGAQSIFNNAPAEAFDIENDGLTVRSSRDLVWGKFILDDNKWGSVPDDGYEAALDQKRVPLELALDLQQSGLYVMGADVEVTAPGSQWVVNNGTTEYIFALDGSNLDIYTSTEVTIAKGQFTMSLNHNFIEIEFVDLKYSSNPDYDVHINYLEQVQLSLKDQNGRKIFWFDQILKSQTVTVTRTQAAVTREIVEAVVAGALTLLVLAGPILEGLCASARIAQLTDDAGTALLAPADFAAAEAEYPEQAAADLADSGQVAARQVGGRLTNIKNALATPKWKVAGLVASMAGAAAGLDPAISKIIEDAAAGKWETVPEFDAFADLAIAPYTFPSISGFKLKSAASAGALQIGLTADQA